MYSINNVFTASNKYVPKHNHEITSEKEINSLILEVI